MPPKKKNEKEIIVDKNLDDNYDDNYDPDDWDNFRESLRGYDY